MDFDLKTNEKGNLTIGGADAWNLQTIIKHHYML